MHVASLNTTCTVPGIVSNIPSGALCFKCMCTLRKPSWSIIVFITPVIYVGTSVFVSLVSIKFDCVYIIMIVMIQWCVLALHYIYDVSIRNVGGNCGKHSSWPRSRLDYGNQLPACLSVCHSGLLSFSPKPVIFINCWPWYKKCIDILV